MSSITGGSSRAIQGAVWVLCVFEALTLGMAGSAKFGASEVWTRLFVEWGYPRWFTFVVGAVELTGAVSLFVPRLTSWAASILIVVMIGALTTVLVHDAALGPLMPSVHLIGLSLLVRARWARRWTPGGPATSAMRPGG